MIALRRASIAAIASAAVLLSAASLSPSGTPDPMPAAAPAEQVAGFDPPIVVDLWRLLRPAS